MGPEEEPPAAWTIDREAARQFLALLGKDLASTRLRAFPHRAHPRREAIGARKGGFDLMRAQRWQREGRGVYVVINDGGDCNREIHSCRALFVEWDDRPIAWQLEAWRELGLPEPTVMVHTGGRSVHCYWVLRDPLPPVEWEPLQQQLIRKAGGDRQCGDASRVMRLPGSWYLDARGEPVAQVRIARSSGQRYGAEELAAMAGCGGLGDSAVHQEAGPTLCSTGSGAMASERWREIESALAAIPKRVAGSNSYGMYRNILWGLIQACHEAGRDREAAIALMEAHSPSESSGWDVRQVAQSGGERIRAATFWFHARRCGWGPEGSAGPWMGAAPGGSRAQGAPNTRVRPQPTAAPTAADPPAAGPSVSAAIATCADLPPQPLPAAGAAKRAPVRLPLGRRLDALEHCIHSLVGNERNSLRRHARVRRAQAALGLKGVLRPQEVGQLILEAHDQRHGNSFQALGSSQRLAMRLPVLAWDIPNCLPSQDLTILGGRAKVGKTRLAHALLRCLLCAEDFLGFGAPERPRPVILISDDQADGDTAAMLQESGMWGHAGLIWSRRFRASEANLDGLRNCLAGQSGAVVMLDSLRSITRSCGFGENDPEMGALIYDLKHQITEAGGTVLLVHHCNKANDTTGTEALSGHNAIAGAANTILTLHYLSQASQLQKESPQRRLVREGRSGPPVDLVVAMEPSGGRFVRIGPTSQVLEEQEGKERQERMGERLRRATPEQRQALAHLLERQQRGEEGLPLLELLQAVGALPEAVRKKQELRGEDLSRYKALGRLLNDLEGVVVASRVAGEGQGYCLRYGISAAGVERLEKHSYHYSRDSKLL